MSTSEAAVPGVTAERSSRRVAWLIFILLCVAGIAVRCVAGSYSLGFAHPDEHQQYLEVAQGIVFGYNVKYWEYKRGVRHYLYPGALAGIIMLFETIGLRDPVFQAIGIRVLMGIAIVGCFGIIGYRWMRRGRVAASLFLMTLAALFPDMVFISVRTLSETAMIIPLLIALSLWDRSRILAGICMGTAFAIRFQAGFFIAAALASEVWDDWRHSRNWKHSYCVQWAIGLAISLFFLGAIDYFTWGSWFHSPIEYFRANILEGKAAAFGTEPWYQYFVWALDTEVVTGTVLAILASMGTLKEPRWAILLSVYFVCHCLIAHKEPRFVLTLLPLIFLLASLGFQQLHDWLASDQIMKSCFVSLTLLCLAGGSWYRLSEINWLLEPSRSVSLALARVGKTSDVKGVVVFGLSSVTCGNYFFLRKNVPYRAYDAWNRDGLITDPEWAKGIYNYLIIRGRDVVGLPIAKKEFVGIVGGWRIYHFAPAPQNESPPSKE